MFVFVLKSQFRNLLSSRSLSCLSEDEILGWFNTVEVQEFILAIQSGKVRGYILSVEEYY